MSDHEHSYDPAEQVDDDPITVDSAETDSTPTVRPAQQKAPLPPRLAALLSFLLPPVGVVLGHLWLFWTKDELRIDQDADAAEREYIMRSRRPAWLALVVGYPLTLLVSLAVVVGVTYYQQSAQQDEIAAIEAEQREELLEAAADSESAGEVSTGFCDQLIGETLAQSPPSGFVVSYAEIDDELIAGYEALSDEQSPNSAVYGDYAAHLSSFDDEQSWDDYDPEDHAEAAQPVGAALDADSLGCADLDEQYLEQLEEIHEVHMSQRMEQQQP